MAKHLGVASEGGCRNQGDDAAALHQLGAMDKLAQTETSQGVGAALCDCVWRNCAAMIAVVRSSAKQSQRSTLRAFVPFDFIETPQTLSIRPVTLITHPGINHKVVQSVLHCCHLLYLSLFSPIISDQHHEKYGPQLSSFYLSVIILILFSCHPTGKVSLSYGRWPAYLNNRQRSACASCHW